MNYCEGKESAILDYQFKNGQTKTIKFNNTPIEVLINSLSKLLLGEASQNINYQVFGTANLAINGVYQTILWKSSGLITGPLNNYVFGYGSNFQTEIVFNNDGSKRAKLDQIDEAGNETGYYRISADPNECRLSYLQAVEGDSKAEIKVLFNNKLIYKDEGNLPCPFNVSCDGCPEGYCKCASTNYPGYCCLPCSEVKNGLLAIARNIL